MEIHHKIKPVHGWREFFGEVGIIVLGVSIALIAEQVVERLHWRHQTELAEEALTDNFAQLLWVARERDWRSYCIGRQLDAIGATIDKADETGRLAPIGPFGTTPSRRSWHVDSWDALVADGAIAHLPREKQIDYGGIAHFADEIEQSAEAEFEEWSQLATIVGPGRKLSGGEAATLRRARSAAAYRARLLRITAIQLQGFIKDADPSAFEKLAENDRKDGEWKAVAGRHDCKPDGPPPESYNYAMFAGVPMEGPIQ